MLYEIYCDKFHKQTVKFNEGFNAVLGTNTGDNSIGKSTFMLIIDFAFGGDTYSKSDDILKNIGSHKVCFKFKFDDQFFCFSRSIDNSNIVNKCDDKYNTIETISNDTYCKWLADKYGITMYGITFRDAVGRYIRVYGKENCDEKRPLHYVPQEQGSKAVTAFLKLFNCYKEIKGFEDQLKKSDEAKSIYEKAQKLDYVAKIGKQKYNANEKEIKNIEKEIQELSKHFDKNLFDADSLASENAIQIKKQLSSAKRLRSKIKGRLSVLEDDQEYKFSSTSNTYEELNKFFPNVDLKHLGEIEEFHQKIARIFKDEIAQEKTKLESQLAEYNSIVEDLEKQLEALVTNPKVSQIVLQKHADLVSNKKRLLEENKAYLKLQELTQAKKGDEEKLKNAKETKLGKIEKKVNSEMDRINGLLYSQKYNAPEIHFTDSSYSFKTPDDTGTGIAYKGLVVFDLSIMHLTQVPILVHDSVVLKQISDDAIEGIVNQYIDCKKQVIIALDKQDTYSQKTSSLLDSYSILNLAPNGEELFGRSWAKKSK